MKKLALAAFALFVLLAGFVSVKAGDITPVGMVGVDADYQITHSTGITISSSTLGLATIPPSSNFRILELQFLPTNLQDGTSVFMRMDGLATSVSTAGFVVRLSTISGGAAAVSNVNNVTVQTKNRLAFQMAPNVSGTVKVRYTEKKLKQ